MSNNKLNDTNLEHEYQSIKFDVLTNALYHTSLRQRYTRLTQFLNFIVILLGTAAATNMIEQYFPTHGLIVIGFMIAAVGSIQLVFDFGGKARTHQSLQRDYYHLLAQIDHQSNKDIDMIQGWRSDMIRIFAEEPPIFRALNAKAYNDALDSQNYFERETERLQIPRLHLIFGGVFNFENHSYLKLSEIN